MEKPDPEGGKRHYLTLFERGGNTWRDSSLDFAPPVEAPPLAEGIHDMDPRRMRAFIRLWRAMLQGLPT